jgi:carbon storage regulator
MLVLTRRVGEEVVIASDIRLKVVMIRGNTIRLGITAPPSTPVVRLELVEGRSDGAGSPATGRPRQCPEGEAASAESPS